MNRINLLNRIRIIISNNIKIFFKEKIKYSMVF